MANNDAVVKVQYGRRINYSDSAARSKNGRKGRGANAFESKITDDMKTIMQRVEKIAKRVQVNGQSGSGASISYPIHAVRPNFKGTKL